jgi:hypothetical protein
VDHKARQILEVTPEAVQLSRRFIDGHSLLNFDDLRRSTILASVDAQRLIALTVSPQAAVYEAPSQEGKGGAIERATFQTVSSQSSAAEHRTLAFNRPNIGLTHCMPLRSKALRFPISSVVPASHLERVHLILLRHLRYFAAQPTIAYSQAPQIGCAAKKEALLDILLDMMTIGRKFYAGILQNRLSQIRRVQRRLAFPVWTWSAPARGR